MNDNFSDVWDRLDDRQFFNENNMWNPNEGKRKENFADIQEAVKYFETLVNDKNDEIENLKLKVSVLENTVAQMQINMINLETKINKKI